MVFEACNPLKSHKTAKGIFGKAWTETRWFWKSLENCKEARHYFATSARPPAPVSKGSSVTCIAPVETPDLDRFAEANAVLAVMESAAP